jgi:hypothetical protein
VGCSKPKALVTHKLVAPALAVLLPMMALPDSLEPDEDLDRPCEVGGQLLDRIACNVPHKLVFRPVVAAVSQLMAHPDPLQRRAGVLALAVRGITSAPG